MEQDNRTYQVFIEYDGCCNDPVTFQGAYDDCISFMRTRRPPKQCQWCLVNKETGRAVSYVL